jgi:hypothetical protein
VGVSGQKLTWTGFLRVDGQLFDWMGDRQNYTPAVQKETVVCTSPLLGLVWNEALEGAESLQVHLDEDSYYHDLRERRLDRHLSEPDRGLCPISHPNPRQVMF